MRYPLVLAIVAVFRLLPAWALEMEQEAKLLPSDGDEDERFGVGVAFDGDTALIGADYDDDNGFRSGSAYVFTRAGGVWTEQAKLLPADGAAEDRFGWSVALDGDTALVGAWYDDDNGWLSGSAYVFTRTAGVWTEQAKLLASDGDEEDRFGVGVALDGDTAIIGACGDNDNGTYSGSAYVFTRTAGVWTEQAKLLASDGGSWDYFGFSVALDGDTALIGAVQDNSQQGSAYVFTRTARVWTEQAKLLASDGDGGDRFGWPVALDGDTALIGATSDNNQKGSAYVFTRTAGVWRQQAKLVSIGIAEGDRFGSSVALVGDTAIIGAMHDIPNVHLRTGSAYVFTRSGGVWTQRAKLLASDGAGGDDFGYSAAFVGDMAIIGATEDDDNGVGSGSAYVFRLCDHRITISTDAGDTLIFLTPDPGLFDLVAGNLSDLLTDKDFSHAICLAPSTGNPAVDPLPDPALGEGRYYLGRPLGLCETEGYGDSSLTPDPRDDLAVGPCP